MSKGIALGLLALAVLAVFGGAVAAWKRKATVNEAATFVVALASFLVALATLVSSERSTDAEQAITNLAKLAGESHKQTVLLERQVSNIKGQLGEQKAQTALLSRQSHALEDQAAAAERTSESAREQLRQFAQFNSDTVLRTAREERWRAIRQSAQAYNQATNAYLGFIVDARSRMTFNIDNPKIVDRLTIADLNDLRNQVGAISSVRRNLDGSFKSIVGDWPSATRKRMAEVVSTGQEIGECLEAASASIATEREAIFVRGKMKEVCTGLASKFIKFENGSRTLADELINIVYDASVSFGVKPDAD